MCCSCAGIFVSRLQTKVDTQESLQALWMHQESAQTGEDCSLYYTATIQQRSYLRINLQQPQERVNKQEVVVARVPMVRMHICLQGVLDREVSILACCV